MKKYIIFLVVGLLLINVSNVLSTPSNTMSVSPSATDGTTITASDENTRNNEISTKYNAHDHTDINQTGNTLNIGDGTYGNKTIVADNAMASQPYFRYEGTDVWKVSNDGTTNFAIRGDGAYSAKVYLNAAQTINTGVSTKVFWNTESFDTNNQFNTNMGRFGGTNVDPAYYLVVANVGWGTGTADKYFTTNIYKNGALEAASSDITGGDTYTPLNNVVSVVDLGATDYIEVYVAHNNGTTSSVSNAANNSFLEVYRLQ